MKKTILLRFGEIFLKGKNKNYFESILIKNIKEVLSNFTCTVKKMAGRFVVSDYEEANESLIIDCLTKVFGLYSLSPAVEVETSRESIESVINQINLTENSFKIDVNRADKKFPIRSVEYGALLGGLVINRHPNIKVNLSKPEVCVYVDIRESGYTYIFHKIVKCAGGMPVGTSAPGLLLLSGGIDSPVAGYMMSKRGMRLHAIHFHSFPYTSENAKQKVLKLAKIISYYTGNITVHVVPFTQIQEEIHKHCAPEFMITIMRRIMMRISEQIAKQNNLKAIITGENLAQVASQTVESMTVTNEVVKNLPIFRPLVAFDKEEIIDIAKKINTYETSILPYEDCCTVFLPEHPVIKPKLEKAVREESKLDIETLVNSAIKNEEIFKTENM